MPRKKKSVIVSRRKGQRRRLNEQKRTIAAGIIQEKGRIPKPKFLLHRRH